MSAYQGPGAVSSWGTDALHLLRQGDLGCRDSRGCQFEVMLSKDGASTSLQAMFCPWGSPRMVQPHVTVATLSLHTGDPKLVPVGSPAVWDRSLALLNYQYSFFLQPGQHCGELHGPPEGACQHHGQRDGGEHLQEPCQLLQQLHCLQRKLSRKRL